MSDTVSLPPTDQDGWRLTGWHVLSILVGFFGIIIITSIVFTTLAVTSFRGEDVKKSYRQGIDYNTTLDARAVQSQLGWTAAINIVGTPDKRTLVVKVADAQAISLRGTSFEGRLRHPVDSGLDRPLTFEALGDGTARADVTGLFGQWTLEATATRADDRFDFRRDLDLR